MDVSQHVTETPGGSLTDEEITLPMVSLARQAYHDITRGFRTLTGTIPFFTRVNVLPTTRAPPAGWDRASEIERKKVYLEGTTVFQWGCQPLFQPR